MNDARAVLKWSLLAFGVAVIHFVAEQASLIAVMGGAVAPQPRFGAFMGSLCGILILPCALVVRTPIGELFAFPSFGYLVLTTVNSLLWGSTIALVVRWLVTRLESASRSRGKL